MSVPTVTVAVATCGRAEELARCLAAVAAGTRAPDAIVVVDQQASDTSRHAVARSPMAVQHLVMPRRGLSASRNHALDACTTDVLAVTDEDCVPAPGWVEAIVRVLGSSDPPGAVCGAILADGPRPDQGYAVSLRTGSEARTHRGRVVPWQVGSGANFAAPTTLLRAIGGWDEHLGTGTPTRAAEDIDLLDRLLRAGSTVRFDPDVVVAHGWETRAHRMATRYGYAVGIGAYLARRARARDRFVGPMLADYLRLQATGFRDAARRRDPDRLREHARALGGLLPGVLRGLRLPPEPTSR